MTFQLLIFLGFTSTYLPLIHILNDIEFYPYVCLFLPAKAANHLGRWSFAPFGWKMFHKHHPTLAPECTPFPHRMDWRGGAGTISLNCSTSGPQLLAGRQAVVGGGGVGWVVFTPGVSSVSPAYHYYQALPSRSPAAHVPQLLVLANKHSERTVAQDFLV